MTTKKKPGRGGSRPGSGRKSKGKRITVHVRLRPDQHAWAYLNAAENKKTLNDFVIALLMERGMPE